MPDTLKSPLADVPMTTSNWALRACDACHQRKVTYEAQPKKGIARVGVYQYPVQSLTICRSSVTVSYLNATGVNTMTAIVPSIEWLEAGRGGEVASGKSPIYLVNWRIATSS